MAKLTYSMIEVWVVLNKLFQSTNVIQTVNKKAAKLAKD